MVEGVLVLYKINPTGGMQRHSQVDLNMGRKFFHSCSGNMQLTRSKDKKIISLTNLDINNKNGQYFKIQAWTTKLKIYDTPDSFGALHNSMNMYFDRVRGSFDELVEVSFVGSSKFIQLVYYEAK